MLDVYPAELRKWIAQRGGLNSKMIFLYGRELAEIVPPCTSAVIASLSGATEGARTRRTSSRRIRPARRSSRAKGDSKARGGDRRHGEIGGAAERRHQAS